MRHIECFVFYYITLYIKYDVHASNMYKHCKTALHSSGIILPVNTPRMAHKLDSSIILLVKEDVKGEL